MKRCSVGVGVVSLLVFAGACIGEEADSPAPPPKQVYVLSATDTVAGVAARFLGDAALAPELLRFSGLVNPATALPGAVLAIPGPERAEAIDLLARASEAMLSALTNSADRLAGPQMDAAAASYKMAEQSFADTAYDRARAQARVAIEQARIASALAEERAKVQRNAAVRVVFGVVEATDSDGKWKPVAEGAELAVQQRVRAAAQSRAEVELPDGSRITINENSEVSLEAMQEDIRRGRMRMVIRLLTGNIVGRIKPKQTDDSEFNIKSGGSAIAIRGTVLRAANDGEDYTRVMVDKGQVVVGARKVKQDLAAGLGLVVKPGRAPGAPVALLPAPVLAADWNVPPVTANPAPRFTWGPGSGSRPSDYRMEIARDGEFHEIVANELTSRTTWRAPSLDDGAYFWHVLSRDGNELEGFWSSSVTFRVARNFDLDLQFSGASVALGDRTAALPGYAVIARPTRADTSVERLEASINGGPFEPFDGILKFRKPGAQQVVIRPLDAGGLAGPSRQASFIIDDAPPAISIETTDLSEIGKLLVTLKAQDDSGVVSLRYRIVRRGLLVRNPVAQLEAGYLDDLESYRDYTSAIELPWPGKYDIYVRARDQLGHETSGERFAVRP